jgi:hypothetical protein
MNKFGVEPTYLGGEDYLKFLMSKYDEIGKAINVR